MTVDPRLENQVQKLLGRVDTEEKRIKSLKGFIDQYIIDQLVLWGRFVPQAATAKITILDADLVLDDSMPVILAIDPGGASRTITAPPASLNNHPFILINLADAAEELNVEDVDANSLVDVAQNQEATIVPDGTAWFSITLVDGDYVLVDGTRAFTGDQSMGTHKLTNVVDPIADQDAATKKYVDDNAGGAGILEVQVFS